MTGTANGFKARAPAVITHNLKREAHIQSRLLDALEARFRRRIAKALAYGLADMETKFGDKP
jgi:hypothetical protein